MALFTNMTSHLINTHSGTAMIPGVACEVNDEDANNPRFQEMLVSEEIASGDFPQPVNDEERAKFEQERRNKERERMDRDQAERAERQLNAPNVPQQPPHPQPNPNPNQPPPPPPPQQPPQPQRPQTKA